MIELGLVDVRGENDVVRAHQTTRTIVAQLGFSTFEQTRIATAMSEIARNALIYASGGSVTLALDDARTSLMIVVLDRGPGIPDLPAVLADERPSPTGLGLGIPGARRLMDTFVIETTAAGTRVEMTKRLPRRVGAVDGARVSDVRAQLAGQLADDPTQEIRRLQRDVLERDARILDLSEELAETNRGVMALHAELEARAEYQRSALELRTRFMSEMGHELRTPLHSLTAISQFLIDRLDGDLTPEQDKQVRLIHEVALGLTDYVNDLLDLARADAGKMTVRTAAVPVDDVLRMLRRIMSPLAPRGVELRFVIGQGLPVLVTDGSKVSQVLRNLVGNALKFTERGHVEVRAQCGASGCVVFEVEDTGVGIAPEHREIVFHEFAQVDGHVQPRMRGSGLGLSLSRRLAAMLGGSLEIVETGKPGSTFRFELPARFEGDLPAPAGERADAPVVEVIPAAGRPRILVIDDDIASRYVLRRWLDERYRVEEAESGQEGLRLAAGRPAAIFLDIVMSDMTGFEVLERLKAEPATRDIPVVVYTALVLGTNDRERLAAAAAILRKSTSSRVADRAAIEDALVRAGIAIPVETPHA
ncbi:MAG TPA: ATP-binding protein [Kofleriaceae bacterium]|nr:ATP-binding protein [Kofleriaceae bacterium]